MRFPWQSSQSLSDHPDGPTRFFRCNADVAQWVYSD